MSFFGTGGEDWVELDLDLFDRKRASDMERWLETHRPRLEEWLGTGYDIETDDDGKTFLVVGDRRRFRVDFGNDDRMIFTSMFDNEGPL